MGGLSIKPSSIGALFSKNPFECLLGNDSSSVIRSIRHFWKMPSQNICEYWCQNWRTRPTKDILGCQMRTILGNSGYYSELQYVQILVCRYVLCLMYWCTVHILLLLLPWDFLEHKMKPYCGIRKFLLLTLSITMVPIFNFCFLAIAPTYKIYSSDSSSV